jgi:hypothetical protein
VELLPRFLPPISTDCGLLMAVCSSSTLRLSVGDSAPMSVDGAVEDFCVLLRMIVTTGRLFTGLVHRVLEKFDIFKYFSGFMIICEILLNISAQPDNLSFVLLAPV